MKIKMLTPFLLTCCMLSSLSCRESENSNTTPTNETTMSESNPSNPETSSAKVLRHVVIFKFNEETSEEQVNALNSSFRELATSIPAIQDFEWGLNDSPENFHQDFTHCYLLTFASEHDRDSIYTPHPKHQAFVQSLQPHLEKVFVVDYWTTP